MVYIVDGVDVYCENVHLNINILDFRCLSIVFMHHKLAYNIPTLPTVRIYKNKSPFTLAQVKTVSEVKCVTMILRTC